jgi:uncharacterized membrane protein
MMDGSSACVKTNQHKIFVDVMSSDILNRNGKSVTIQDQSQGRTRRVFRLVRALRRVKTLRPVLLYYEM